MSKVQHKNMRHIKGSDDDSSDDEVEQVQYKVIILGDGAVGKTSITMRITEDTFAQSYKQTIGVDFFIKRISLPGPVDVTLQIWDIGGQQLGGSMLQNYIFGSSAVILAYDITNYQSFKNLEDWFQFVKDTFKDKLPYIALVGNKIDLNHLRAVKVDVHENFCVMNDMHSFFMSAKTGDSVNTAFKRIAADLSGVNLSKADIEVEGRVLEAKIIDHPLTDHETEKAKVEDQKKSKTCSLQ